MKSIILIHTIHHSTAIKFLTTREMREQFSKHNFLFPFIIDLFCQRFSFLFFLFFMLTFFILNSIKVMCICIYRILLLVVFFSYFILYIKYKQSKRIISRVFLFFRNPPAVFIIMFQYYIHSHTQHRLVYEIFGNDS